MRYFPARTCPTSTGVYAGGIDRQCYRFEQAYVYGSRSTVWTRVAPLAEPLYASDDAPVRGRFGWLLIARRSGVGLVLVASVASAQVRRGLSETLTGDAKVAYEAGELLFGDGDYAGAEIKFKAAYDTSQDARLLWNMAACEKSQRHYARTEQLVRAFIDELCARERDERNTGRIDELHRRRHARPRFTEMQSLRLATRRRDRFRRRTCRRRRSGAGRRDDSTTT